MSDNRTYRNDEVEGSGEEHVFSSEDERGESKSDDCTDDSQHGDDRLANSDSDEEDTDIESDISDSEDAQSQENTSKYSKSTIKNYAKFRLLNVDRRWGRNIKFILMMFDWIQKSAIFAYQRRLARSSTGGRLTRAEDVLDRSFGVEGLKYKSALFQKFSALLDEFGSPQLFGTFSCDDKSDGQFAVARHFGGPDANTHDDPVLFTMHWKRQWLRFWKFVTSTRKGREGWAMRKTGGIRAWCWVFELQDRDEEGRYVLPRAEGDERINGYNMDLLRFGRVNMDLQYNEGDRAKYYMCKYVTEQAGPKQVTIVTDKDKVDDSAVGMSSSNEDRSSKEYITHFHYRSVGVVEAVMDICGI
ncbi:hypothetical protein BGX24_005336 [Mortierella sp. AD032]|nr:hypothetical protein BGX24_005336 [Mortierella sp. AD032]